MAAMPSETADSLALSSLRRRGQFLVSSLMWAAVAGLAILLSGYLLILYHYGLVLAERIRGSLGWHAPPSGPDWFLLSLLALGPLVLIVLLAAASGWYRRIWSARLREVWKDAADRKQYSGWRALTHKADEDERSARALYLSKLRGVEIAPAEYESKAEAVLAVVEQDIAERALATGLIVGISRNRFVDLFTIFTATLELQLHVLSMLGKRPSWRAWRLLLQRCGASLFINSYLNRQDALMLNLMVKKAGMGLHVAGDLMSAGAAHLAESDVDLDEALGLSHGGLLGLATKGLEMGATMALTVGQVGLQTLGMLIESVGDELAQGALAAGIIYYHGISLASDTLALDRLHRHSPAMNRSLREAVWKMGEVAGTILLDFVRQRRIAFRERRQQMVKSLPRTAYGKLQSLFGRRAAVDN